MFHLKNELNNHDPRIIIRLGIEPGTFQSVGNDFISMKSNRKSVFLPDVEQ